MELVIYGELPTRQESAASHPERWNMEASSITQRTLVRADFRRWAWWQLPWLLRLYVGIGPVVAVVVTGYAASQTTWRAKDLAEYCLLLGCGVASVVAKRGAVHNVSGVTRDFVSAWILPVAILLPPIYALVTPVPLQILTQMRVGKGVVYRRAFTAAVIGLCYGAASLIFRAFPDSFAGGTIGGGRHALTWVLAVAACEFVGGRGHNLLISIAIKISDPKVSLLRLQLDREGLQGDFAESDLGILITIVVGVNVALAVVTVPTVLLIRTFMMHEQLLAQSRIDTKTGLLNSTTWEAEATAEVTRAVRTHSPLSLALIDIDHFKRVNDTHGHLVGDKVLRAVTDAIQQHLRSYDLAGRFGGEEFVVLLPQARQVDAVNIAERLRKHIAAMSIPVRDGGSGKEHAGDPSMNGAAGPDDSGPQVRLTISVGVAALSESVHELNALMAAADAALYHAKQTGRNKTSVVWASESAGPADSSTLKPSLPTEISSSHP
ncbi:MAG TPA: GGDEF domain-containing protein [Streptosporangiaceae bacterium]